MGGKPKNKTPEADYTIANQQKLREQEEADKYRREQRSRRNNRGTKGRSLLSYGGAK